MKGEWWWMRPLRARIWHGGHGVRLLLAAVLAIGVVPAVPIPASGQSVDDPPCCIGDYFPVPLHGPSLPSTNYRLEFDGKATSAYYMRHYLATAPIDAPSTILTRIYWYEDRSAAARAYTGYVQQSARSYVLVQDPLGLGDESALLNYGSGSGAGSPMGVRIWFRRGPYVIQHLEGWTQTAADPAAVRAQGIARARVILNQLNAEIAKQVAALPPASPTPTLQQEQSPLVKVITLRDAGSEALAAGDADLLAHVAARLAEQYAQLAAQTPAPEAAAYHASATYWVSSLFYGAEQALAELTKRIADAAVPPGDYSALQRSLTLAEAQLYRLESVTPASFLAGYHENLVEWLAQAVDTGARASAELTTRSDGAQQVWSEVPALPAPRAIPIDGGLLLVPQAFHVTDPNSDQAFAVLPPGTRLWDAATASGPACAARGRPKLVVVSGQRGATSAYPAACFESPVQGGGTPSFVAAPPEAGPPGTARGATGATYVILPGQAGLADLGATGEGGQVARGRRFEPVMCQGLTAEEIRPLLAQARRLLANLEADLGTVDLPVDVVRDREELNDPTWQEVWKRFEVVEANPSADRENRLRDQIETGEMCLEYLEGRLEPPGGWPVVEPSASAPPALAEATATRPPAPPALAEATATRPPAPPALAEATATRILPTPTRLPPTPTTVAVLCIDATGTYQVSGAAGSASGGLRIHVQQGFARLEIGARNLRRSTITYTSGRIEGTFEEWFSLTSGPYSKTPTVQGEIRGTLGPDGRGSGSITGTIIGGSGLSNTDRGTRLEGTWTTTRNSC